MSVSCTRPRFQAAIPIHRINITTSAQTASANPELGIERRVKTLGLYQAFQKLRDAETATQVNQVFANRASGKRNQNSAPSELPETPAEQYLQTILQQIDPDFRSLTRDGDIRFATVGITNGAGEVENHKVCFLVTPQTQRKLPVYANEKQTNELIAKEAAAFQKEYGISGLTLALHHQKDPKGSASAETAWANFLATPWCSTVDLIKPPPPVRTGLWYAPPSPGKEIGQFQIEGVQFHPLSQSPSSDPTDPTHAG